VEDQETPPPLAEPEDQPEPENEPGDGDGDEDKGPPAGGRLLSTAALLGFAAVLVVFAMVMSALYVRERNARADSDRLLAASNAQLSAAQDQLNAARGGPSLDPKGYDAIKQCVLAGVDEQRRSDEIQQQLGLPTGLPSGFPNGLPTPFATAFFTVLPPGTVFGQAPGGSLLLPDTVSCEKAATYLK